MISTKHVLLVKHCAWYAVVINTVQKLGNLQKKRQCRFGSEYGVIQPPHPQTTDTFPPSTKILQYIRVIYKVMESYENLAFKFSIASVLWHGGDFFL